MINWFTQNGFNKNSETAQKATQSLREQLKDSITLTEDYTKADYAILFLTPSSGEYFNATPGYLELDLCEGKTVPDVDNEGRSSCHYSLGNYAIWCGTNC